MDNGAQGHGAVKRFSGDGILKKEYRRWKKWAKSSMATHPACRTDEAAKGPWIYTLLDGSALEAVDHLDFEDYGCRGGDAVLWEILDKRFPQPNKEDELGETLDEVFGLMCYLY